MPEHICLKYSLTSTNSHVSERATFLANSPYINSSSLSKMATFLADGLYIDFCLNLCTKATSFNNIGQPQYYK